MSDPSIQIGKVLKRVRFEQDLTLEEASRLTGVSKTMLGQIERGESNPTVSVLWKIASGLRVSFTELLAQNDGECDYVDIKTIEPILESEGKMKLYDVFSFNPIIGFEYFYIELLPGAHHVSEPHANAVKEFVVVTQGAMRMKIGELEYIIKAPAAVGFAPDKTHIYSNPFKEKTIFQNIVKY